MADTAQAERRYSVQGIRIARSYAKEGDYIAEVSVKSTWGDEIKINLPEERVEAFIDQVSDLILESLQSHFSNLREDFRLHQEEKRAKLSPPIVEGEMA